MNETQSSKIALRPVNHQKDEFEPADGGSLVLILVCMVETEMVTLYEIRREGDVPNTTRQLVVQAPR